VPALAFAWVSVVSGCASPPPPISHLEDRARLDVPIAVCRKPLSRDDVGDGGVPRSDVYWGLVFAGFRGLGGPMRATDVDCVGEPLAANGVTFPPIGADDSVVSADADGTQVVWLRSSKVSDTVADGPIAVVRPRTSDIDLYAIGRYRGSPRHSAFDLVALGTSRVVVAHDEGCADVKVDTECDSTLAFYVVVGGTLVRAADSPAQRVRFGTLKGLGRVQYRLTTDPTTVDGTSIRVHEKLQVRDSNDEDIRKAEGDRVFALQPDGRLVAAQDSLWPKLPAKP
jgi:hypothetical protein